MPHCFIYKCVQGCHKYLDMSSLRNAGLFTMLTHNNQMIRFLLMMMEKHNNDDFANPSEVGHRYRRLHKDHHHKDHNLNHHHIHHHHHVLPCTEGIKQCSNVCSRHHHHNQQNFHHRHYRHRHVIIINFIVSSCNF